MHQVKKPLSSPYTKNTYVMRNNLRVFAYILVALLGAGLIVMELFPYFEKTLGAYLLLGLGIILVIDSIRSLIRYFMR